MSTQPSRMTSFWAADRDTGAPCSFEVINPAYVEWLEKELANYSASKPAPSLTRGEAATLDRALRMYAAAYQAMVGNEPDPRHKADLKNYITRADELISKLRVAFGRPA